jgi:DNA end-binding protein Ku
MNPRISEIVPERPYRGDVDVPNKWSSFMAPRAYWKGFLRLSLVTCPIALYPATSEREKIHFHQINRKTGNRIQYKKVDADTHREVDRDDIIKAYEKSKGEYIPVEPEELEAVAIESKRTIEIDQFVPRKEIDELYFANPYYIVPDGEAGAEAYAVIRDAIEDERMMALGRVVFTSREHIIGLETRGKGIMGITLRYPYEVRDEKDYFADIPNERVKKDMLDLAKHIIKTKTGHFRPESFEDRYEDALKELLRKKDKGEKIEAPAEPRHHNVINLMEALRQSVRGERSHSRRRRSTHQRKPTKKRATTRSRKAS